MMLLNVVLILMVAFAGVADVEADDTDDDVKKCQFQLFVAVAGTEVIDCAFVRIYVKCYVKAKRLYENGPTAALIAELETIFITDIEFPWKHCRPNITEIIEELVESDGGNPVITAYVARVRRHYRPLPPDCRTQKPPTPSPTIPATTLKINTTSTPPTPAPRDPECVEYSSSACLGRPDGNYTACDQLRCERGFVEVCTDQTFSESRCPLGTYVTPSGSIQQYLVYDRTTGRCERKARYCPRPLVDQYA